MKKLLCAALVIMLIILPSGCKKKEAAEVSEAGTNVTVFSAVKSDVKDVVNYNGNIMEGEYVSITAKTSAKVQNIFVEEGDYVEAGTVLAKLDETDLRLVYNQALAGYNSAVAAYDMAANASSVQSSTSASQNLSRAQIAYNDAKLNLDRTRTLYDAGAATKVQLESAESAEENARLNLSSAQENKDLQTGVVNEKTIASAKAGVDAAKASLDIAANNLSYTTITTPASGYISSKNIVKGQYASPGVEIFSVKNSRVVEAEINITESDISFVKVGTDAEVKIKSANGSDKVVGKITMANPVKDAKTGLYKVHIEIPNKDGKIKVGMIAEISLVLKENKNVIAIPSDSIIQDGEKFFVFVASQDGKTAQKVEVIKGIENPEKTEIVSGIKEGDKIIVKGKEYLSEKNNKIKITATVK